MSVHDLLDLEQGVWIDRERLTEAGLAPPLRVVVREGEIRIVAAAEETPEAAPVDGWDVFRSLGSDAPHGRLKDAAADHDRHLYGKRQ